jgi:Ca2+-transporting ATPase
MTVVRSVVGGIKLKSPADIENLSPVVSSLILEGIAQNSSGSVFEPEVMPRVYYYCSLHT